MTAEICRSKEPEPKQLDSKKPVTAKRDCLSERVDETANETLQAAMVLETVKERVKRFNENHKRAVIVLT